MYCTHMLFVNKGEHYVNVVDIVVSVSSRMERVGSKTKYFDQCSTAIVSMIYTVSQAIHAFIRGSIFLCSFE